MLTWGWIYFALNFLMLFILISDSFYFSIVKRHMSDEILTLRQDGSLLWHIAIANYLGPILIFFALVVIIGLGWRKLLDVPLKPEKRPYLLTLLVAIFLFLSIRGSVSAKPISTVDAFMSADSREGHLVLNGIFTSWHALLNWDDVSYSFLSNHDLEKTLGKIGIDSHRQFPFLKKSSLKKGEDPQKYNVVIFLLESWGSYYVDSLGNQNFGATPFFDELAKKGVLFPNFFAHGSRSIEGIQSVLTSFPALKGLPDLGVGLELMNLPRIGDVLAKAGYETFFLQSAARRSFRLDAIATALGFQHYFGGEDYPKLLDYHGEPPPQFGWDYEAMMFLVKQLNKTEKPFFSFLYTGTSHTPFRKTPMTLDSEKHETNNAVGFLNTLYYVDSCLKEFFNAASMEPWFENTIFIITADHVYTAFRPFDFLDSQRVPLLIYAPRLFAPAINLKTAAHLDILPTLLDLLPIDREMSFAGTSLFDQERPGLAWISGRYGNPALITDKGFVRHTLTRALEKKSFTSDCDERCLEEIELELLALNQITFQLMKMNRWQP